MKNVWKYISIAFSLVGAVFVIVFFIDGSNFKKYLPIIITVVVILYFVNFKFYSKAVFKQLKKEHKKITKSKQPWEK